MGGEGESDRTVVVVKRRERGQVGRRSGANLMSRVAVEVWCVRMWIAGWSSRSEREIESRVEQVCSVDGCFRVDESLEACSVI